MMSQIRLFRSNNNYNVTGVILSLQLAKFNSAHTVNNTAQLKR